jgi:hypothetical protein
VLPAGLLRVNCGCGGVVAPPCAVGGCSSERSQRLQRVRTWSKWALRMDRLSRTNYIVKFIESKQRLSLTKEAGLPEEESDHFLPGRPLERTREKLSVPTKGKSFVHGLSSRVDG